MLKFEAISTTGSSHNAGIRVSTDEGRNELEVMWYTSSTLRDVVLVNMVRVNDEISTIARRCAINGAVRMYDAMNARIARMASLASGISAVVDEAQPRVEL